jgi:hypothetical protein
MAKLTDTKMLNWLDKQSGKYTGKVLFRWSSNGRGWRLHETDAEGAKPTVREAIQDAMKKEKLAQDPKQFKDEYENDWGQ